MSETRPEHKLREALLAQEPAPPAEAYEEYRRMLEQQLLEAAPALQQRARRQLWTRRTFGIAAVAACLVLAVAAAFAYLGDAAAPEVPGPGNVAQPNGNSGKEELIVLGGPPPGHNAPQAPRPYEPLGEYFLENVDLILIGVAGDPIERKVALPKKKAGIGGVFEPTRYRTEKLFQVKIDKILFGSFGGKEVKMTDSKPILGCIPTADEMRKPSNDFKKGARLLIYLNEHNGTFFPRKFLRLEGKEDKLPAQLARFLAFVDASKSKQPYKTYEELLKREGLDVPAYVAFSRINDPKSADVLVEKFDVFKSRALELAGPVQAGSVGKMTVSAEFQRLLALLAQFGDTRKLDAILTLPAGFWSVSLKYLPRMCRSADAKEIKQVSDQLLKSVKPPDGGQDLALVALTRLEGKLEAGTQARIRKQVVAHLQAIRGDDDSYTCYPLLVYLLKEPDDAAIDVVLDMVARRPVKRINELCLEQLWTTTRGRLTEAQRTKVIDRGRDIVQQLRKKPNRTREEQNLLSRLSAYLK